MSVDCATILTIGLRFIGDTSRLAPCDWRIALRQRQSKSSRPLWGLRQVLTVTEQRKTEPAMIAQALAAIDPATHGRQAGRTGPTINVGVGVQVAGQLTEEPL